jgi:hypothetical protein
MDEIVFKKKAKPAKPEIRGVETITIYDKGIYLRLGYCAYSIFKGKDQFLFDFCTN